MRRPIIAGNWKMYGTPGEAAQAVQRLGRILGRTKDPEVVVCPPFVALHAVYQVIESSRIRLGAQDMFWEREGAYTGEISAYMLREIGCNYVIVGHSERRALFGETNETVARKIRAALDFHLTPIVCVGERLEDREGNRTEAVVEDHVSGALAGLDQEELDRIVIAYEPVWAIGTGKTATPKQANEVHLFIRNWLKEHHGEVAASGMRILYGGSVKPENVSTLMSQPDIDGALVGGASLDADSFASIVQYKTEKP